MLDWIIFWSKKTSCPAKKEYVISIHVQSASMLTPESGCKGGLRVIRLFHFCIVLITIQSLVESQAPSLCVLKKQLLNQDLVLATFISFVDHCYVILKKLNKQDLRIYQQLNKPQKLPEKE